MKLFGTISVFFFLEKNRGIIIFKNICSGGPGARFLVNFSTTNVSTYSPENLKLIQHI